MVLSHKYKFIFIAIPRTGSSSIIESLRVNLNLKTKDFNVFKDDICRPRIFPIPIYPGSSIKIRKHIKAAKLKEILGDEIWNSYYKFAFVRNPWDHILSFYLFLKDHGIKQFLNNIQKGKDLSYNRSAYNIIIKAKKYSFKDFVYYYFTEKNDTPFLEYISGKNSKKLLDFVGKFENLQTDFNRICDRLNIKRNQLPHLNKTAHDGYVEYYDNKTKGIVEKYCKEIIDNFGYKFGE